MLQLIDNQLINVVCLTSAVAVCSGVCGGRLQKGSVVGGVGHQRGQTGGQGGGPLSHGG